MSTSNGNQVPSSERDRRAMERDEVAQLRDLTARARDDAAEARERWAEAKLAAMGPEGQSPEELVDALKRATAAAHALAAADRARAAADRQVAARDRAQAALDRRSARIDLRRLTLDELEKGRGSGERMVLAFVDVDERDQRGRATLHAVAAQLRSDDPVVRIDGGTLVCGFSSTPLETARRRMQEIQAALERDGTAGPVRVAFAELGPGESLAEISGRLARDGASPAPVSQLDH